MPCVACQTEEKYLEPQYYYCERCCVTIDSSEDAFRHIADNHVGHPDFSNRLLEESFLFNFSDRNREVVREIKMSLDYPVGIGGASTSSFCCSLCTAVFSDKPSLLEHVKFFHDKTTVYECSACGAVFAFRVSLQRHMDAIHKSVLEPNQSQRPGISIGHGNTVYHCNTCLRQFANASKLARHIATHTGEPYFLCREEGCGHTFSSQQQLSLHRISVHQIEAGWRCSTCGRVFAYASVLKRHEKTHAKVTDNLVCQLCNEIVYTKAALDAHNAKVHRQGNALECPTCNRVFRYPSEMDRHLLSHSSVKDFQCPVCSKAFKGRVHLLKHLRKVHFRVDSNTSQGCRWCGRQFVREANLLKHCAKDHSVQWAKERSTLPVHIPDLDGDDPNCSVVDWDAHKLATVQYGRCGSGRQRQ